MLKNSTKIFMKNVMRGERMRDTQFNEIHQNKHFMLSDHRVPVPQTVSLQRSLGSKYHVVVHRYMLYKYYVYCISKRVFYVYQEYSVQLTFREQWMDERLKFNDYNGKYMEITQLEATRSQSLSFSSLPMMKPEKSRKIFKIKSFHIQ